ncbi:MAG: hypothetical protein IPO21_20570 [Bacteroidales bacterium]|nr:hypothetical protein [Bacteroidales bacterium]
MSNWCRNIVVDSLNNLWICGSNGIEVFSIKNNRIITDSVFRGIEKFKITYPYDLVITEKYEIIVVGVKQACIIDMVKREGKFLTLPNADFEPASVLYKDRIAWIVGSGGLLRCEIDTDKQNVFEKRDGISDNQFMRNASCSDEAGIFILEVIMDLPFLTLRWL